MEVQPIWSDDGIVIRLPAAEEVPTWGSLDSDDPDGVPVGVTSVARATEDAVLVPADEIEELVVGAVGSSALFASRFRENAARALLLPRRRPGSRTPLWQMRQRASQLLAVASRYGSFPIILETYRECLQDVFDLPALRDLLAAIERREIRVVSVETQRASPFASSLLFDYIASYMYEGDAPLADRRAQALTLDRDLLRELLGAEELRELLDADAITELELELQALTPERAAGSADQVHDLLRGLGDLSTEEVRDRVRGVDADDRWRTASEWLGALAGDRMIQEIGDAVATMVRRSDIAARIDGGQFSVLVPGGADEAAALAQRLLRVVLTLSVPASRGREGRCSVSAGVASFEADDDDQGTALLDRAERALDDAKAGGRNRVTVFTPEIARWSRSSAA